MLYGQKSMRKCITWCVFMHGTYLCIGSILSEVLMCQSKIPLGGDARYGYWVRLCVRLSRPHKKSESRF